ncbi:MAG: hypothetical protein ABS942_10975 [Solibacillus sp.]
MSKFKVGNSVKFDTFNEENAKSFGYEPRKAYEVVHVFDVAKTLKIINENGVSHTFDFERFELVESKPTKNQRITALENEASDLGKRTKVLEQEVAELKVIVHQLRKPSTDVQEALGKADWERGEVEGVIEFEGKQYKKVDREAREGDVVLFNYKGHENTHVQVNKPYLVNYVDGGALGHHDGTTTSIYSFDIYAWGRTPENVDVYELIEDEIKYPPFVIPEPAPVKSPNEKRAEMIEKAKVFLEQSKTSVSGKSLDGPNKGQFETFEAVYSVREPGINKTACEAEFIVIEEKRKVICLLRGVNTKKVYHRGFAKCMPSDVFNEHIGKAIALGRALGLDVSEFEQAVQPTEKVVGMQVLYNDNGKDYNVTLHPNKMGSSYSFFNGTSAIKSHVGEHSKIINDTNAQYDFVLVGPAPVEELF